MTGIIHDAVICGGALVGGSMACALRGKGLRVALLESSAKPNLDAIPAPRLDERTIALSYGSRRIFEGMGLWDALKSSAQPITQIHISDRGHFGFSRLYNHELSLEALGYVLSANTIITLLQQALQDNAELDLFYSTRLLDFHERDDHLDLEIEINGTTETLSSRLLIAADGGDSPIRQALQIQSRKHDYLQNAVITTVMPHKAHAGKAYERFTGYGPLALLPMYNGRCAAIWSVPRGNERSLLKMNGNDFLDRLQQAFGWRLGRFTDIGERHTYALSALSAKKITGSRTVLVGNAAHTVHPIAGQGLNLGLRDVSLLAQKIVDTARAGGDPGSVIPLAQYARQRQADLLQIQSFTDGLVKIFGSTAPPVILGRNLGLLGLDRCPPMKYQLLRRTAGLSYACPRLSRGLPL